MQHVYAIPLEFFCELRSEIRFSACDLLGATSVALLFFALDDMQLLPPAVCCCRCRVAIDKKKRGRATNVASTAFY